MILKSLFAFESVKPILGTAPVKAISPPVVLKPLAPKDPVVAIFCAPKSGEIFVPAIAALAFISAFTIVPSAIFAEVTAPSAILKELTALLAILLTVTAPLLILDSCIVLSRILDAVTALSGSGPAYFFLLMEQMIKAGISEGLNPEVARELVVETALGSAKMASMSIDNPKILRENVTSPGGTTEAALDVFYERGFVKTVAEGIK